MLRRRSAISSGSGRPKVSRRRRQTASVSGADRWKNRRNSSRYRNFGIKESYRLVQRHSGWAFPTKPSLNGRAQKILIKVHKSPSRPCFLCNNLLIYFKDTLSLVLHISGFRIMVTKVYFSHHGNVDFATNLTANACTMGELCAAERSFHKGGLRFEKKM